MRLADISFQISQRLQGPAKSPSQIANETRQIVLRNAKRMAEYNLRAAHEHVYDMERRLRLAQQASGVSDLLRIQVQRVPESGLRVSADIMRNADIAKQTYRDVKRLLKTEMRKQLMLERDINPKLTRLGSPEK